MARPQKFKEPQKLNLYVEKSTVLKARKIAKRVNKSISDLFSEFIATYPDSK